MSILPVLVNFDRNPALLAAESLGATPGAGLRQVLLPQIAAAPGASACTGPAGGLVFGAYGTALPLVGTQLQHPAAAAYSLMSEPAATFPGRRRPGARDHRRLRCHHDGR